MYKIDNFSSEYLRIALEIGKHLTGYVEIYYGPEEIKKLVHKGSKIAPAKLLDDLYALREKIPINDKSRHRYLSVTLQAIECIILGLMGEEFEYFDEIYRISNITPKLIDETIFVEAQKELDDLLSGQGNLYNRNDEFRKKFEIKAEQTLFALNLAMEEACRCTKNLFDLIEGENVLLSCGPGFGGNSVYQGNFCSQVEIYTNIPVSALRLADMMAHETYPGHHTEAQIKDSIFHLQKGYGECAIVLLATPMCAVGEGIGMTSSEIIYPENNRYEWETEILFPTLDIQTGVSVELLKKYNQAINVLYFKPRTNAAILYNSGQLDQKQTMDYLQTYSLEPPDRLQDTFERISSPLGKIYVFNYTEGYHLISQAAQKYGDDKMPIFRRLLHEQVLPSDICDL